MNIFHKYALESLKKNKFRTIVTIIGVILSVSLFTAVFEGAGSGVEFLRNVLKEYEGSIHGVMLDLTEDQTAEIRADKRIDNYVFSRNVGTGTYSSNLMRIESMNFQNSDLFNLELLEGRYPESENEIILPESNFGHPVGEHITISMKKAGSNGALVNDKNRDYVVTGVYRNRSYLDGLIYDIVFSAGKADGNYTCYYTLRHPSGYFRFEEEQHYTDETLYNSTLLELYGASRHENRAAVIYRLAFVLSVVIAVASVSLIYNSFSISVTERTRQFGILKSAGATKKQIVSAFLYEALIISLVSVPAGVIVGCTGIGITLRMMQGIFRQLAGGLIHNTSVNIGLVLNPVLIAVACAFGIVTVFVSAWIPAKRAVKTAPIEAVRQNRDIAEKKIKNRKNLTEKFLGFEGMMASRNFRRNKKRNRTVVFSLVLSIVLFISSMSFTAYFSDAVNAEYTWNRFSPDIMLEVNKSPDELEDFLKKIESSEYTDELMYCTAYDIGASFSDECFTEEFRTSYEYSTEQFINVVFASDEFFRKLCLENGTDPEKFFDRSNPCGMFCNRIRTYNNTAQSSVEVDMFNEGVVPLDIKSENGETYRAADITQMSFYSKYNACLIYPYSMMETVSGCSPENNTTDNENYEAVYEMRTQIQIKAENHEAAYKEISEILKREEIFCIYFSYPAGQRETEKMYAAMVEVFSIGFIILISMISSANIINTVSTNISLRRREMAMLRSTGMSEKSFSKMMNTECLVYGVRSILWSIPLVAAVTRIMYRIVFEFASGSYFFPVIPTLISVISVFAVVFISMLFSASKIKKENIIDILRNENI